jgi:virulence-associated protein VapD
MYAVAFDLVVADTEQHHPKGVTQAYTEIGAVLAEHGFRRVQGSLYVTENEDMANLFLAIRRCEPWHGFRSLCATFAHSISNNGQISPLW